MSIVRERRLYTNRLRLLPFPRCLRRSLSSLETFFPLPSTSSSLFSSVSSTLPDAFSLSRRDIRANGMSAGFPSAVVVSFDGGANEPTNSGSRVIKSGWIYDSVRRYISSIEIRLDQNGTDLVKKCLNFLFPSSPLVFKGISFRAIKVRLPSTGDYDARESRGMAYSKNILERGEAYRS